MFKYSFFFNILSDNRLHCGKRKSKTNYTYVHTYSPLIWQTCINENVGQYIMMDVKWMGKTIKKNLYTCTQIVAKVHLAGFILSRLQYERKQTHKIFIKKILRKLFFMAFRTIKHYLPQLFKPLILSCLVLVYIF